MNNINLQDKSVVNELYQKIGFSPFLLDLHDPESYKDINRPDNNLLIEYLKNYGVANNKKILEVGCQDGHLSTLLYNSISHDIVGIDTVNTFIQENKQKYPNIMFYHREFPYDCEDLIEDSDVIFISRVYNNAIVSINTLLHLRYFLLKPYQKIIIFYPLMCRISSKKILCMDNMDDTDITFIKNKKFFPIEKSLLSTFFEVKEVYPSLGYYDIGVKESIRDILYPLNLNNTDKNNISKLLISKNSERNEENESSNLVY